MESKKVTFITTVLNEEETIRKLLDSLLEQTKLPYEVIVTDGGSSDGTLAILEAYKRKFKKMSVLYKVILKEGNRAIGRNEAIKHATGTIIACSDAGCVLDKNWLKNLVLGFQNPYVDVVAGYYKGLSKTIFEKALIPYVLVMEDRVNPDTFLPASRSMAFRKDVWERNRRFPINYSHNEDYVFAKTLKKTGARIVFKKDAIVYWIPRATIKEAFIMFLRFAIGDAEAGILRPKVGFLFARYFSVLLILIIFALTGEIQFIFAFSMLFVLYSLWSISKNYKYVNHYLAFLYLPILQFISDSAVLLGTTLGIIRRIWVTRKTQ